MDIPKDFEVPAYSSQIGSPIEIIETTRQKKTIFIEFPYYYEHDLMIDDGDSIIYGKIEEGFHTTIHENESYNWNLKWTYEIEQEKILSFGALSSYFDPKFKSSKDQYEKAKQRAFEFLNKC